MSTIIHTAPSDATAIDPLWFRHAFVSDIKVSESGVWFFTFSTSTSITVECMWRILVAGAIACTSEDHRQQFGLPAPVDAALFALEHLKKNTVEEFTLRPDTLDLLFGFSNSHKLEILVTSAGYEGWQIISPGRTHVIAQGGGQLCTYTE